MSRHFDTATAKDDPRLNLCDFYLFEGVLGHTTVLVMTVNPDAGLSAPATFHDDGLYAFRIDLNSDAREELAFKFRFGQARQINGDKHHRVQSFQVRKGAGPNVFKGAEGEFLLEGNTDSVVEKAGVRAFAGLAPDLFAGNSVGLRGFVGAYYKDKRCNLDAFRNRQNFFAKRNISAIVLEVPNEMIGPGKIRAWATASLCGHAPEGQEVQVSRWGLPLVTHLFFNNPARPELKEQFNRSTPADDKKLFFAAMADFVTGMAACGRTTDYPGQYGKQIAERLCPVVLPYQIGTRAEFELPNFNGRPPGKDVMDVMLSLVTNQEVHDGAVPDLMRVRNQFPYFGPPYSPSEQQAAAPATKK